LDPAGVAAGGVADADAEVVGGGGVGGDEGDGAEGDGAVTGDDEVGEV
jgi:hypothetical protein